MKRDPIPCDDEAITAVTSQEEPMAKIARYDGMQNRASCAHARFTDLSRSKNDVTHLEQDAWLQSGANHRDIDVSVGVLMRHP